MIITKTPFRVSFFGGGTDYPTWYKEHGGAVLSSSIDKYGYITCRFLPPFFDYKYRISYSLIELVKKIEHIQHPSVRACLKHLNVRSGVEIHYDGDLPARTGLGSSSTFTVGLLKSLYALQGKVIGNLELGMDAMHVEQNVIQENVGGQDQLAAAVGGFNLIEFGPGDKINVQPFVLPSERLELLQAHMMLIFTGLTRIGSALAGALMRSSKKKKRELSTLHRSVYEAIKILNSSRDDHKVMNEFGRLLHEGWMIKRGLVQGITNPVIDAIYEQARKAGALGGKLLGAGGGGFILLFASPEKQAGIKKALKKFLPIPFRFESLGSQIVYYRQDEYNGRGFRPPHS